MRKKSKPLNSTKRGLFPLRKKHTKKTLKKDVSELRKNGYPVKIALHTLDVESKKLSTKTKKSRGLSTASKKKYVKKKR